MFDSNPIADGAGHTSVAIPSPRIGKGTWSNHHFDLIFGPFIENLWNRIAGKSGSVVFRLIG